MKKKLPAVIWFTGLSGSGKSTIAEKLVVELKENGVDVEHLDGDTVRDIFPGTGFTKEERDLHIKRMGFISSLLEKHGVTVVCTFVSPYRDTRDMVRRMCKNFIEVYISTPLEVCEQRDVKGLYKRARNGEIKHFTGLDDPYEAPTDPEIDVDTLTMNLQESVKNVLSHFNLDM
jgi:adenylylsulfate kinase